jgi:hypothetical protein
MYMYKGLFYYTVTVINSDITSTRLMFSIPFADYPLTTHIFLNSLIFQTLNFVLQAYALYN